MVTQGAERREKGFCVCLNMASCFMCVFVLSTLSHHSSISVRFFFVEVVPHTAPPSSEHAVTEMWDCPTAVKEFAGACC